MEEKKRKKKERNKAQRNKNHIKHKNKLIIRFAPFCTELKSLTIKKVFDFMLLINLT